MEHSFNAEAAKVIGIEGAILLGWFMCRTEHGRRGYDGKVWIKKSIRAINEIFPYMTEKKIQGALRKLKAARLIEIESQPGAFDRTLCYSITEAGKNLLEEG